MTSVLSETKLDLDHVEHVHQAGAVGVIIDEIETVGTGNFIWLVSTTASIGGFLFGYDTGIISGVLVYLHDDLGHFLSPSEKELVTSLCSAGAFVGAIAAGLTADNFGRKVTIYFASVLFTVGAVIQAAAYSLPQMAVGRLIVGFGVGSAATIVPLYLAEIAPARYRGRVIGLNNMSITFGSVIAYAIGAAFASVSHGWRYMVGLGGVPSAVLFCLQPFIPESPRQLIFHGQREQARQVLERIYHNATPAMVDDKIRLIELAVEQSKENLDSKSRWAAIKKMHFDPAYFRALVCACGLMVISQMSGFNTLLYYSGTLFSLVGFSNPVAVGIVVAAANFCCTGINAFVVDRLGRRRVLLLTVWGMSAGLIAVAIAFTKIPIDLDTLELKQSTVTTPAIVVLVFIIWFCIFYGLSVGNIAWMSTDFFPLEVRALGSMWMTCCNWGPNLIVSSTFLTLMKSITPSGAFGFYGTLCGIGWVLIIFYYPEVSGLTIEEVSQVFRHGFGVRYARDIRIQRQAVAKSKYSS